MAERSADDIRARVDALEAERRATEGLAGALTTNLDIQQNLVRQEQIKVEIAEQNLALAQKLGVAGAADAVEARRAVEARKEDLETARKLLNTERELANVYAEAASTLKGLSGINNSMQQRFIRNLLRSRDAGGGLQNALQKVTDELTANATKGEFLAATLQKSYNLGMRLGDTVIQATKNLALAQDNAFSAFARMTGQTGALRQEMIGLERGMFQYGVSLESAMKSQAALFAVVTQFTSMTVTERNELGRTAVLLDRFGVSADQTARNMQIMTTQMGMGAHQAAELSTQMFTFAQKAGIATSKVSSDFANLAPQLMAFGDQTSGVFMRLEMAAKQSGMAIEEIVGLASRFNRFDTAADSVGRLNAILGGPYLSTIRMVMTTDPTARMQMLADAVRQAGRSFEQLGYYERLALTEGMGLKDVGQLALVMRGEFENLSNSVMMTGDQFADLARQEREYNSVLDEYRKIIRSVSADMLPLVRRLGEMLSYLSESPGVLKAVAAAFVGLKVTLAVLPVYLTAFGAGLTAVSAAAGPLLITFGAVAGAAALLFGAFTRSGSPKFYEMGYHIAGGFNAMAGGAATAAQGVGVLGASVTGVARAMKDLPDMKVAQFKTIMQETRRVTEEVASAGAGGASLAIGVARAAASAGGGYGPGATGQDIVLNVNLDGERIQRNSWRGLSPVS